MIISLLSCLIRALQKTWLWNIKWRAVSMDTPLRSQELETETLTSKCLLRQTRNYFITMYCNLLLNTSKGLTMYQWCLEMISEQDKRLIRRFSVKLRACFFEFSNNLCSKTSLSSFSRIRWDVKVTASYLVKAQSQLDPST